MDFLERVRLSYNSSALIENAYHFAEKAHGGAKRRSGEPYFIHPVSVATILIDYKVDEETIAAALLHDVVEDTKVTFKTIREEFGAEVEKLVKGVSKIGRMNINNKQILEMDSLKRLFIAMSRDIRVIMIKLADRLHNIRTVEYLDEDRRFKFCSETMNLFVPLAERMGFTSIKNELEDTCFKYLAPNEYKKIKDERDRKYKDSEQKIQSITEQLKAVLKENNLESEVSSRFKNLYSLYKKIQSKGTGKIYDAIAFRIITDTVKHCYEILGIVHSLFRPVPGRVKDYIAFPKSNGYKSLHTTVLMKDGTPFEVQIRTKQMHEFAEYGIASHWRYKTGETRKNIYEEEGLNLLKDLVNDERSIKNSEAFINALKMELSTAEIWVLTPKYRPVSLPVNSTPVDFAYAVHSDIGDSCTGAKVNGKKVPLNYKLQTGDVVEIITEKGKKPSRDFLRFVVTSHAKSAIRNYFKKSIKPENVKEGRRKLEEAALKANMNIGEVLNPVVIRELERKYLTYSNEDLYASISAGGINVNDILNIAREEKKDRENKSKEENDIYIDGSDISGVKLAHCCTPVPGDKIKAIQSSSGAFTVHHEDCLNLRAIEKDKLLPASWKDKINPYKKFDLELKVGGRDEERMLSRVIDIIYESKIVMKWITARLVSAGRFEFTMVLRVSSISEAKKLINQFRELKNVQYVNRENLTVKK